MAEGHLSRCHEPGGSSLILAGESFPILAGGSSVCAQGLLPCDGIGLFSRCGGGLGVPLKLGQVTWGSFIVVIGPPLELHEATPL